MMLQSILTILIFLPILIASKGHWSYENVKTWSEADHYCGGNRQSPINLRFNLSQYEPHLRRIYFQKRNPTPTSPQLTNNGHTAQLNLHNNYIVKHVAPFSGDYIVEQLHFHWGHSHNNTDGSEHLLEGQTYPLEMHVVSYSNSFSNIKEAMTNVRALAVIGVFFELSNESNEHLQPIVDALKHIRHQGAEYSVSDEFKLIPLISEDGVRRYYRYDGSLTTPPCYESVIWSVLQAPLPISLDQLNAFRALHDDRHRLMKDTYRSIQPLGERKLFRSFPWKEITDESDGRRFAGGSSGQYSSIHPQIVFVLISFVMIII